MSRIPPWVFNNLTYKFGGGLWHIFMRSTAALSEGRTRAWRHAAADGLLFLLLLVHLPPVEEDQSAPKTSAPLGARGGGRWGRLGLEIGVCFPGLHISLN